MQETGLTGAKPSIIPMEQNHKLLSNDGPLLLNVNFYRRLVGRLVYLTITRPDIAYSVHVLSQFLSAPKVCHMDAALKLVRYLKSSPGQGLLMSATGSLSLNAYCDADWGGCALTRQSLTGYCVTLGSSLIS